MTFDRSNFIIKSPRYVFFSINFIQSSLFHIITKMSVRPITESEKRQAFGGPFLGWFFVFGATQGLLSHLRFSGATV